MGITAGSREVPGRNACDRRHTYCIIIIILIMVAAMIIMMMMITATIIIIKFFTSQFGWEIFTYPVM